MNVGGPASLDNFIIGGVGAAITEVIANGAREEPSVLKDHAEERTDIMARHLTGGDIIDSDVARVGVVEAHEEIDDGSLAGASGADEGDLLTRFNLAGKIGDSRLILRVAEIKVVEGDCTSDFFNSLRGGWIGSFLRLFEEIENALGGSGSALKIGGELRKRKQRMSKGIDILDKGLDRADGNLTGDGEVATENTDGNIGEISKNIDDWEGEAGEKLGLPTRIIESLISLFKGRGRGGFVGVRLNDKLAGEILFNDRVEMAEGVLLALEIFTGTLSNF